VQQTGFCGFLLEYEKFDSASPGVRVAPEGASFSSGDRPSLLEPKIGFRGLGPYLWIGAPVQGSSSTPGTPQVDRLPESSPVTFASPPAQGFPDRSSVDKPSMPKHFELISPLQVGALGLQGIGLHPTGFLPRASYGLVSIPFRIATPSCRSSRGGSSSGSLHFPEGSATPEVKRSWDCPLNGCPLRGPALDRRSRRAPQSAKSSTGFPIQSPVAVAMGSSSVGEHPCPLGRDTLLAGFNGGIRRFTASPSPVIRRLDQSRGYHLRSGNMYRG
jgi:hypothetical protein